MVIFLRFACFFLKKTNACNHSLLEVELHILGPFPLYTYLSRKQVKEIFEDDMGLETGERLIKETSSRIICMTRVNTIIASRISAHIRAEHPTNR